MGYITFRGTIKRMMANRTNNKSQRKTNDKINNEKN